MLYLTYMYSVLAIQNTMQNPQIKHLISSYVLFGLIGLISRILPDVLGLVLMEGLLPLEVQIHQ